MESKTSQLANTGRRIDKPVVSGLFHLLGFPCWKMERLAC